MLGDIRFVELKKLLESHGWRLARINGSHHIFARDGERPMSIPVHRGKVKRWYVEEAKKKIRDEK